MSRIETIVWRIEIAVLCIYGALFVGGIAGSVSPSVEDWILGRERVVLAVATVGVLLNLAVWGASIAILTTDADKSQRYVRSWMVLLVVGNLMASLIFLLLRRRRGSSSVLPSRSSPPRG